ncbi:MAG: hypothetical protein JKY61_09875, partial [Planctomycetes bacterium]|nr:hypothetical protein [Planctomycetota bacterium]
MKPRFGRMFALLPFLLLFALAGFAEGQGLSKTLYKDRVNGFKFRPPSKYDTVPARDDLQALGILSWMDSQVEESGGIVIVIRLDDAHGRAGGPYKAKSSKKSKRGKSRVRGRRPALTDFLSVAFDGLFRSKIPMEERAFKLKGVQGLHRKWRMGLSVLDAYTYKGSQADIHLLYFVDQAFARSKSGKKWPGMHVKSGRSFERMAAAKEVDLSTLSYDALLRYHKVQDAQYKDWRVMSTPSKKYIVKTSSKRGAFIKNAITRLERSRKLFEKDFPPEFFGRELNAVSVVRICSTAEEFHKYG